MMKQLKMLGLAVLAVTAAACGSSSDPGPTPTPPFPQPTGTVAVNFKVDDTANKVYTAGSLSWKGQMKYDTTTRKVAVDDTWGGPFATLYDDGPWSAGGHEPAGAVAGDNIWGVTVFTPVPATGATTISYGLVDTVYDPFGNGWIWQGNNGSFTVTAGATAEVNATGMTMAKFGTTDMQLVLDTNNLDPTATWNTTTVAVKSSYWGWSDIPVTKAADGKATFVLSTVVGAGKKYIHTGLLSTGAKPEFVWVLNGVEYKIATGASAGTAASIGVTAATQATGTTTWTSAPILINASNKNTYITSP
jgi:hypothetical protein